MNDFFLDVKNSFMGGGSPFFNREQIKIVKDWEEIRVALLNGATVFWHDKTGNSYCLLGFEKMVDGSCRYYARDEYGVDCVVFEDGRIGYYNGD